MKPSSPPQSRKPISLLVRLMAIWLGCVLLVVAVMHWLLPGRPVTGFGLSLASFALNVGLLVKLRREGHFRMPPTPEEDEREAARALEEEYRRRASKEA